MKPLTKSTEQLDKSPLVGEKITVESPVSEVKSPKITVSKATTIDGRNEDLIPDKSSSSSSPSKVSSTEKWQSFYKYKHRPAVVQVTSIPVSRQTIRNENLWHMMKDENRRNKRQTIQDKTTKTAYQIQESKVYWNAYLPLSELKKRDVLFTEAVTKENTIRSTAMVQPSPNDPKPSTSKRKKEGKRIKITKKIDKDHYLRTGTKTAKSIFDLMNRRR